MVDRTLEHHLNQLIRLMNDSVDGYAKAAELTESNELRILFSKLGAQRTGFAEELSQLVEVVGGETTEEGTFRATLFRAAKELEVSVSGDKDMVILRAIRDVLNNTIDTYTEILSDKRNITREPVRQTIEQQHQALLGTQTQINNLIAQRESM